ncbi:MAG: hypothetical protein ACPIOQ_14280, partial [Promethearchaeia archaeon]
MTRVANSPYGARRRRGHVTQDSGRWKAQNVDGYRRLNLLSPSSTVSHYLHERQSEAAPRLLSKAIPAMCAYQNSSVQAREEVV